MSEGNRSAVYLAGPTASGKTAIGIELARRIGGEILSLDAYAVYRGMDIGTAKPTPAERAGIPHHLIDIVDPNEVFDVAQYMKLAADAESEIRGRGNVPIFVGGTPMYLKTLVYGIFDGPPGDPELRARLEAELRDLSPEEVTERLARVDPVGAARLHPNNRRRIIRALEVYMLTGRPISEWQTQWNTVEKDAKNIAVVPLIFVPEWDRATLHGRINRRVDKIFAAGFVEEVRRLLADPCGLSRTAVAAIGYREVAEFLEGSSTLNEAVERTKARTRQFARRQWTFLRGFPESQLRWLPMSADTSPAETARRIAGLFHSQDMIPPIS